MNTDNLKKRFSEAGLRLEIATAPLARGLRGRGSQEMIQLDIKRAFKGNARSEYFELWPGHEQNLVVVQGVDKKLAQLVLMLKEPKREFFEPLTSYDRKELNKLGYREFCKKRVIDESAFVILNGDPGVWRATPEGKRYVLLGRDERQMFMCQLPRAAATVRAAHEMLKAPTVFFAEGKTDGKTIRQGEWFFVNLTDDEKTALDTALKKKLLVVQKKRSINQVAGSAGKPHVAEELVVVPAERLDHGFSIRPRSEIYVRGKVAHVDHKTVYFSQWRKVIRNQEVQSQGSLAGGTWMD